MHRTLDAGQAFLLRTLQRQQIEPAGVPAAGVVDAHGQVERGVKVRCRVQLLDRHHAEIRSLRPTAIGEVQE